jgi:hypothetical protein
VSALPREAREGLMRAWLDLLNERHPGATWIAIDPGATGNEKTTDDKEKVTT